ncbi:hypothetical protein HYX13_04925 [Candidatus Woesearchaeota archaeon]|nr:hypothetical protein [Candidatus Woesearchaeota archaeon]
MSLENILTESIVMGSLFTTMEVGFTAALTWEQKKKQKKENVVYISPFQNRKEKPLHGFSYPIMFALGTMAAPYMQYIQPHVEHTVGNFGSYAIFGLGVCAVEYACGRLTDISSGKINLAPWREVYTYLEQRIKETFPSTKNVPLALGKKSVFLPLLPAWMVVGAAVDYLHNWMQKAGG